jgi:hypothetical protein
MLVHRYCSHVALIIFVIIVEKFLFRVAAWKAVKSLTKLRCEKLMKKCRFTLTMSV